MKSLVRRSDFRLFLAAALAAGMWCYADLILVPHQVAEAARREQPRGNLSDLYPRWLGARELLLHGRDPYGSDVTREIQAGYYGRELDFRRPNDPKDQQGFAYPIYVVFLLAPTMKAPFATVQLAFRWILILFIAASVPLWLWVVGWRISAAATLTAIFLILGSFPSVQAIKLQQLSVVVCLLLAASAACLVRRRLVLSGVLLALATIKPQLAIPFTAWLLLWTLGNWRSRQRLLWSFLAALTILVLGGELVLPGWIARFRGAAAAYLQYAGGPSLLDIALTPVWGRFISGLLILIVALLCWRWRRASADSEIFRWNLAIVLTATLAVIPTSAPYNQLLLIPALLLLARWAPRLWHGPWFQRLSIGLVVSVLALPWLAAAGLDFTLLFVRREIVESAWVVPLWTSWAIPFPVLAAVALCATQIRKEESSTAVPVAAQRAR